MPRILLSLLFLTFPVATLAQQPPDGQRTPIHGKAGITLPAPPRVKRIRVVDTYKSAGSSQPVRVTDDYRYLEDAKSPATRAFIDAQNAYTEQYLRQVKQLPQIREGVASLLKVDSIDVPERRGDRFFYTKRLAAESQGSLYMRTGLHGSEVRLIDARNLSKDQNTSALLIDLDDSGSLMAYGIRVGGADELEIHFLDVATRKQRADVLPSARYYGLSISPDGKGVYYSKFFPHEGTRIFFHAFGAASAHDKVLFGGEYRGEKLGEIDNISLRVTDNGHYLVLKIGHGVPAKREDILLQDLRKPGSPFVPLVYGVEGRFDEVDHDDTFFVDTDYKAPNHRILKTTMGTSPDQWATVIPEGKNVIEQVNLVDGKLYILRLKDVKSDLTVYNLEGQQTGTIKLPALGAASTLRGRSAQRDGFYTFQSIINPPTVYHYDTATRRSEVFASQQVPFDPNAYQMEQVFFRSKDGTRVPMFIAGKKSLKRDGQLPLLMTGYGGFAVSLTPAWSAMEAWWLQQGGWFAMPNLRGGNEYGEAWHKAAMFEKKQNVFDDWFAAAEYLVREKYTSPAHLAISGRSNGGLLMGASMTQRPDLFGAIWCGYPLLDMLRYQLFLMGRTWTTEYGSAENAADFPYIYRYSPYQHVRPGVDYPATMFFTGDGDTRVDPMNARKMTAAMQAANGGDRPILLHYSLKGGHSSGISQSQLTEDYADELAFLWTETAK